MATASPSPFGPRGMLASRVLSDRMNLAQRKDVWSAVGLAPTLQRVARLFMDLDLSVIQGGWGNTETEWSNALPRTFRHKVQTNLRRGRSLFTPTGMLQAIKEIVEFADESSDQVISDADFARCIVGINQDIEERVGSPEQWEHPDSSFLINWVAQQSLSRFETFETMASQAQEVWRVAWPETTGPKLRSSLGSGPQEVFAETSGGDLDDFLGIGWLIWNLITHEKKTIISRIQLEQAGASSSAVDSFIRNCTWTISDLRASLTATRATSESIPWLRYTLQMRPFVQISNGSFVPLRMQYIVERFLGQPLFVQVHESLKKSDVKRAGKFSQAIDHTFEVKVGKSLSRIQDAIGGYLIHENEMIDQFRIKKGQNLSICDFAYIRDGKCVLIDANNRHLMQAFAEGNGTTEEFRSEIKKRFSEGKFQQLATTIRQFREHGWSDPAFSVGVSTQFIPFVVVPEDGIPSNHFVEELIRANAEHMVEEFDGSAQVPRIITWRDLQILEGLADRRGRDIIKVLTDWRIQGSDGRGLACSLQEFLQRTNPDMPMGRYQHQLGFDFFEDMRRHQAELAVRRLPPEQQAEARAFVDHGLSLLPRQPGFVGPGSSPR